MVGFLGGAKRKSEPATAPAPEDITLPDAALHVVPGRALVTMRGALSHCAVIKASDLPGGEARLKELYGARRVLSHDDAVTAFRAVEDSMNDDEARECRRNLGLGSPSDHFGPSIPSLPAAKKRLKDAERALKNLTAKCPEIIQELALPPSTEQLAQDGSWAWRAVGHTGMKLSEVGASVRAAQAELAEAKAELERAQRATELALARQSSRYAVAPGKQLVTPSGRTYLAGDTIEPEDFGSPGQRDSPADVFAHHLASGTIVEKRPELEEPEEAVA